MRKRGLLRWLRGGDFQVDLVFGYVEFVYLG